MIFQLPIKQLSSGVSLLQFIFPHGFNKLTYFISVDFLALVIIGFSAVITLEKEARGRYITE